MTHEPQSPTTRTMLERIAAILDVPLSAFLPDGRPGADGADPTAAECEQVAMLYSRIPDARRRAVALKLLREMAKRG